MSTDFQLNRMQFRPSPMFNGFSSLSENGQDIYMDLVDRYKLPAPEGEEFEQWQSEVEGR